MARRPPSRPLAKPPRRGLVLDAGAFIALERRSGYVVELLARLVRARVPLVTSGGVLAQVWRGGGGGQPPIALLLPEVEIGAVDATEAKVIGMVLGAAGAQDPIDAHVVLLARERAWPVLTFDRAALRAIDPAVEILEA